MPRATFLYEAVHLQWSIESYYFVYEFIDETEASISNGVLKVATSANGVPGASFSHLQWSIERGPGMDLGSLAHNNFGISNGVLKAY